MSISIGHTGNFVNLSICFFFVITLFKTTRRTLVLSFSALSGSDRFAQNVDALSLSPKDVFKRASDLATRHQHFVWEAWGVPI